MKSNIYMIAAATVMIASCSSPEKKTQTDADSIQPTVVSDTTTKDSAAAGTLKSTGSMNDSNNSGVNSSDGIGQKADKSLDDK